MSPQQSSFAHTQETETNKHFFFPHPNLSMSILSLFIESIDVGDEEGPRTIVSGLRPYMPASELEGKDCVVLCNLKPRNMRGVKSHGMLLCASDKRTAGEEKAEVLSPPQGTPVGERLCFGEFSAELPDPDGPNKIQKKKVSACGRFAFLFSLSQLMPNQLN